MRGHLSSVRREQDALRAAPAVRWVLPDEDGPLPAPPSTVRVRRFTVPLEAVREDLRAPVENERIVRAVVVGLWMTAAFLIGFLLVLAW
jgi:hypothetical protein